MDLCFDPAEASQYHSNAQKIRCISETWVSNHVYCPVCGQPTLRHYENNRPVADFFCPECCAEFELKSKSSARGELGRKVVDGAYDSMISRITSDNNPHFLFLTYWNNSVNNLMVIPNFFFSPSVIEARKPLAESARRAGWTGCTISMDGIPSQGKIFLIRHQEVQDKTSVISAFQRAKALKIQNIESRGWLLDVLSCTGKLKETFTLSEIYSFVPELAAKHPDNHHIEEKIRQQLQILRDKGLIAFAGRGQYRRIG